MMDLWGMCPECEAWFSCDPASADWSCPACDRDPVRLENRATMPFAT